MSQSGLDAIHQITKNGDKTLRIEMSNSQGEKRFAQYEFVFQIIFTTFKVYLFENN